MTRTAITAPDAPTAIGPFSHAIRSGDLLFCSGQVAADPASGELVGTTAPEQAVQCLKNLAAVCAAAGADLAAAVRTTVYLRDMSDFAAVNEAYAAFFPSDPPARVCFAVAGLPKDARVEIDAVVAVSTDE